MNTANCYIVNGPGYYKLPLVYGNAIKNGADNPSAYNTSETGTTVLNQFLRHDDLPITGPYIYEQASPAGASLVWMDQPNLIAEVDLTDNGRSLYFYIKQEDIMQGNAVVAVHDAKGTILWSWHIWVTPLVNNVRSSDVTIVNVFGQTYNLMEYNLGWCAKRTIRYGEAPRSVQVCALARQELLCLSRQRFLLHRPIMKNPFRVILLTGRADTKILCRNIRRYMELSSKCTIML